LGCSLFARHYSGSRDFFPFLRLLRCFSSPAYLPCPMYSGMGIRALPRMGFPIRRSRDHRLVSTSPGLIAATHVLHRLLAPRHPPCALVLLIEKNTSLPLWSFQGARGHVARPYEKPPRGRSLKTQQRARRGRRSSRRALISDDRPLESGRPSTSRAAYRSWSSGIPRKEVIQPQLPLRLPCYDFTPITNPTFDGCLPCGLAHRLRVLPAFVV
jgi:hypothetical protein